MAATYKNRVAALVKLLGKATDTVNEIDSVSVRAEESADNAKQCADTAVQHANAANTAQTRAEESSEQAQKAAESAIGHAGQSEAAHVEALNKLTDAESRYGDADASSKRSAESATESAHSAQEASAAATKAAEATDEIMSSHKQITFLLTQETSSVLAELYRRDSQPNKRVDILQCIGMAVIVGVIVAMHLWVLKDDNWYVHAGSTLPLWFLVAMINRSFNDRRMVRGECSHTERIITAVIGFKHEFGENTLNQEIKANTPIGKLLAAIERNPAERMKVGTDGLWGAMQAFAERKSKG